MRGHDLTNTVRGRLGLIAFASLFLSFLPANVARASNPIVTFEDLNSGTQVTTQYRDLGGTNQGVEIGIQPPPASGVNGWTAATIVQVPVTVAHSGTNVVSVSGSCPVEFGCSTTLFAKFPFGHKHVSLYAGLLSDSAFSGGKVVLVGYDLSFKEIPNATFTASLPGARGTHTELHIDSPSANIAWFELYAPKRTPQPVVIDDLSFDAVGTAATLPDFDITALANSFGNSDVAVSAGSSATTHLFVTRNAASTGPIIFSATNLPEGVTASFNPNPADTFNTDILVTIKVADTAPVGTKTAIILQGKPQSPKAGSQTRTVSINLVVQAGYAPQVLGIQVIQGVQVSVVPQRFPSGSNSADYNGVLLVQGGKTIARVFANLAFGPDAGVPDMAISLTARHDGQVMGTISPDSGTKELVTPSNGTNQINNAMVGDPNGAYTFTLPLSWTGGTISLTASAGVPQINTLDAKPLFVPCTTSDCLAKRSFELRNITFLNTWTPPPVDPISLIDDQGCCVFTGSYNTYFQRAKAVLPLGDDQFKVLPPSSMIDEYSNIQDNGVNTDDSNEQARQDIEDCCHDHYYSWPVGIDHNSRVGRGVNKYNFYATPTDVVTLKLADDPNKSTNGVGGRPLTSVAHELTHALGRQHASACTNGGDPAPYDDWPPEQQGWTHGVGLDRYPLPGETGGAAGPYRILEPGMNGNPLIMYDYMSYCSPNGNGDPSAWASVDGWQGLTSHLHDLASSPFRSYRRSHQSSPPTDVLTVRGFISRTGLHLSPIRPAKGTLSPTSTCCPPGVEIIGRGPSGNVLARVHAQSDEIHVDQGSHIVDFVGNLPAAGVASVAVLAGGTTIGTRTRSAHAPDLEVMAPRQGDTIGSASKVDVTWRASDLDRERLMAKVEFSNDGARTWRTVYSGTNRNLASLPSSFFSRSSNAAIRITITDGFNQTSAIVDSLTSVGHPPVVTLTSPADGSSTTSDSSVYAGGYAFDDALNPIRPRDLVWTVNGQRVGTGEHISMSTLPPGRDTLTLTATDAGGRSGTATVTVRVKGEAPQFLKLLTPTTLARTDASTYFTVAATSAAILTLSGADVATMRYRVTTQEHRIPVTFKAGETALGIVATLSANGLKRSVKLKIPRTTLSARDAKPVAASTGHKLHRPATATTHGAVNACKLMTASDAMTIAGGSVQKPVHTKAPPFFDHCSYLSTGGMTTVGLSASSSAMIAASHSQMKSAAQLFDSTGTNSPYKVQKISGVGTRAFYLPQFHQLWVLKSDVVFDLQVLFAKADRLAQMKKVAAQIVGRL